MDKRRLSSRVGENALPYGWLRRRNCVMGVLLFPLFASCSVSVAGEGEDRPQETSGAQTVVEDGGQSDAYPPSLFRRTQPAGRWGSVLVKGPCKKQRVITGQISFTPGKKLRFLVPEKQLALSLNPFDISCISVEIQEESIEREWQWVEMGIDRKEFTGRSYPDRTYSFVVTMKDGTIHRGRFLGFPLYVTEETGGRKRLVVRPRQRGGFGQELPELSYVAGIIFHRSDEPCSWSTPEPDGETSRMDIATDVDAKSGVPEEAHTSARAEEEAAAGRHSVHDQQENPPASSHEGSEKNDG